MWTRCVCILYLLLMCRAQLEPFERKFYDIIGENYDSSTTTVENNMSSPIENNNTSPIENNMSTPIVNNKTTPNKNNKNTPNENNKTTPNKNNKTTPIENNNTSPIENNMSTPIVNNKTTPNKNNKNTPNENNKTTPNKNNKTTPIENNNTSPNENNETTPIENNKSTPIENNKITAIENNKSTPIENNKTTPIENNKAVGNGKTCTIDASTKGVCKKTSECEDKPKKDPVTNFVYRSMNENNKVNQCGFLEICCPLEQVTNVTHVVKKNSKPIGCGYSDSGSNVFAEKKNVYDYANFGEFPWMIALLKQRYNGQTLSDEYIGGGALINPSVVITVAHKVFNMTNKPGELKCRAGEWNTMIMDELRTHQDRAVSDIILHPKFDLLNAHNDVALLILRSPFDLSIAPHIGVACLEPKLPPPGTVCYSMGWGTDFMKGARYANELKKIKLQLVDAGICQNQFRNTRLGQGYTLHRSLTCAGGEAGVDTCIGDGGSPLVCSIPGGSHIRHAVVGLVAFSPVEDCGLQNIPGSYVNVPEIYSWVFKEINFRGFNTSTFVY